MKVQTRSNLLLYSLLATVAISFSACAQNQGNNESGSSGELKSKIDSVSYFLGSSIGENMKSQDMGEMNIDAYIRGLRDAMEGDSIMIDKQAGQMMVRTYMKDKQDQAAEGNLKEAEDFLAENKKKEGVKTTDSGLQYKVLKEGDGPKPSKDDRVEAHYEGTLPDGTVFDSSYERGKPFTTPVGRVIPGWTEVLQMMPVGSKYRIWLHPDLAYGKRGAGQDIGPNQLLIFEMELLDIKEGKAKQPQRKAPATPK